MQKLDIVAAARTFVGAIFIMSGYGIHVLGVLVAAFGVWIDEGWREAVDFFHQQR